MNPKKVTLILVLTILCSFILASQSIVSAQTTNTAQNNPSPKITFERVSHDFGKIKPGSTDNIITFVFKNTGNANLVISDVENSCSCTISNLLNDKKEYAPGESGTILAGYTDTQLGQVLKHIYISSNDPENPKTELAIKAEVAAPIDYTKKLEISPLKDNGGCEDIVIKSLDNKPFSITGFQSTGNCINVQFNPQEKATQFVLKPQVDMVKIKNSASDGSFKINLSHPDCEVVSGTFSAPPRFVASPRMISISEADPKKPVIKTINIVSNYNEAFSVQASSKNHIVSILETKQTRSGYQVTVEIKPPVPSNNAKNFKDDIKISISGGDSFVIPCNGYYPGTTAPKENEAQKCKICGPKSLDNPQFNPKVR
jgi:hypothetical protein